MAIKLPAGQPREGYFGPEEGSGSRSVHFEGMEIDEPDLPRSPAAAGSVRISSRTAKISQNFEKSGESAEKNSTENRQRNKELRQAFKKKRKDRKRLQKKADRLSDVLASAMDIDKGGNSKGENYNFADHFG